MTAAGRPPGPRIRRAVPDDAGAIAGIQARGWSWGYRGQLPDAFLDALSAEDRSPRWRELLANEGPRSATFVATGAGRPAGFVSIGPSRDGRPGDEVGEVYAIYVEPDVAGTGVGRALLGHATAELGARGFRRATLWVLATNARARRFYEVAGWRADGAQKVEARGAVELHEVRYAKPL